MMELLYFVITKLTTLFILFHIWNLVSILNFLYLAGKFLVVLSTQKKNVPGIIPPPASEVRMSHLQYHFPMLDCVGLYFLLESW